MPNRLGFLPFPDESGAMVKFTKFEDLDDEGFFAALVTEHFTNSNWSDVFAPVGVEPIVDSERVKFAFEVYQNNLKELRLKVHSNNPDHLKRAACLLYALTRAEIITDMNYNGDLVSSLEEGTALGLSHDDCQHRYRFVEYIYRNGNYVLPFDLTFRCCQVYEDRKKPYTFNYLEHVTRFLEVGNADVESLHMLLTSYWAI
jgi:hypothetical protein